MGSLIVLAGCGGAGEHDLENIRTVPQPSGLLPAVPEPKGGDAAPPSAPAPRARPRAHAENASGKPNASSPASRGPVLTAPSEEGPARPPKPRAKPTPAPAPAPAKPKPRPLPGHVVYSRAGDGPFTTAAFPITGRRWSITYRNSGDFFQALILEGGKPEPFVLSGLHPGSRTQRLQGPGRFRLRITGADRWSVTIRDGV